MSGHLLQIIEGLKHSNTMLRNELEHARGGLVDEASQISQRVSTELQQLFANFRGHTVAEMTARVNHLEAEGRSARATESALRSELSESRMQARLTESDLQAQLAAAKHQLASLQVESRENEATWRQQREAFLKQHDSLEASLEDARGQLLGQRAALDREHHQSIAQVRGQLAHVSKLLDDANADRQTLFARNAELEAEFLSHGARHNAALSDAAALLREKELQLHQAHLKTESAMRQASEWSEAASLATRDLEHARSLATAADEAKAKLAESFERLRSELAIEQRRSSELAERAMQHRASMEACSNQLASERAQWVAEQEDAVDRMRHVVGENARVVAAEAAASAAAHAAVSEVNHLRDTLASMQRTEADLHARLRDSYETAKNESQRATALATEVELRSAHSSKLEVQLANASLAQQAIEQEKAAIEARLLATEADVAGRDRQVGQLKKARDWVQSEHEKATEMLRSMDERCRLLEEKLQRQHSCFEDLAACKAQCSALDAELKSTRFGADDQRQLLSSVQQQLDAALLLRQNVSAQTESFAESLQAMHNSMNIRIESSNRLVVCAPNLVALTARLDRQP